ncbi:MAG TPA: DUF2793 domain-containing protein [Allosphingosinicella sp.]|nr:DUF2793 domain-containing protein [Allosphingosinicella sp.]
MSDATARLSLPFIMHGQAQKELYHNEALARIDMALHAAVEGQPLATPPADPAVEQGWIVGGGATGEWSGKDESLACWTEGGWRFVVPVPGMCVWNKAAGYRIHWTGSAWSSGELPVKSLVVGGLQVIGERQPAVPSPSGGTVIDEEARAAVAAITAALKSHGLID